MSCPKYDLTVRAGPSIDELKPIAVNDDAHPAHIQTDAFDGFVTVRVRNHPPRTSAYFEHSDDTFCIQVVGRFLKPCTADDLIYGNQFERPLRLPTGSSIAVKFAKWFDPGLKSDLYAPKPHAFSPLIITMNKLKVQSLPRNEPVQWPSSHGEPIVEDVTELSMDLKQPKDRRSFFSIPQNRKSVDISENQVWSMEFSNPYLDFNKVTIPSTANLYIYADKR